MDLMTIATVASVALALVTSVMGYVMRQLHTRIEDIAEEIDEVQDDMKQTQRKDAANRDIDRVDRDIGVLRHDITKQFEILRSQMQEDKREVLDAIARASK